MKVPVSWLREYIDFDVSVEELAEKLTFSGIEVEGIVTVGSDYEGVVAGEVRSVEQHPNADRLRLCRVFNGAEELQVVCGASNFEVGDIAPFAGVGVVLPGGFKLKKAKIRGEESFGMLCAEDELEISDDHDGIMILPRDTVPGTPLSDILGPPDTVLVLEITWNRPDCLSVIGIAREFAALLGTKLKVPEVAVEESGRPIDEFVSVELEEDSGCSRYTARALEGIKIEPSPLWMQRRLAMCGVRPINNIVDVTNYVMLESGHPLHAFDYRLLSDSKVIVRLAEQGEKMATLDEVERVLTSEMTVIADPKKVLAVAGIMGGAGSEIHDDTTTVLLESACFDPRRTHRTGVALGLSTESSHRFERSVDAASVDWASNRAAQLMQMLAGGRVAAGMVDVYHRRCKPHTIRLDIERMHKLLGYKVGLERSIKILESLMIPIVERGADYLVAEAPSFRFDLEREADLVEEIVRMYGLKHIPAVIPRAAIVPGADDAAVRASFECRKNLIGLGLLECVSYSFLPAALLDGVNRKDRDERVVLPNPVSADQGVMRNSLVPQMIEILGRNHSRQITDAAMFEIGKVFWKDPWGKVCEEDRLCIGVMGKVGRDALNKRSKVKDEEVFLWTKGIIEGLMAAQRISGVCFRPAADPCCENGEAVDIMLGEKRLGFVGMLRKDLRHKHRMAEPVAIAELSMESLLGTVFATPSYRPVAQYPAISRDMAIIVDRNVSNNDILKIIKKAAPAELTGIDLFDIFIGEGMKQGKKSLAYSLTYRSFERTLTDEDANKYHESIKKALKDELGVDIREG